MTRREEEYLQLLTDADYMDVRFNPLTGGLQAIHALHVFHPKRGHFEREVAAVLFGHGDKIILGKERAAPGEAIVTGRKHVDGMYNDDSCEIATITGTGKNAVRRAMEHCESKKAEIAILYFPDAAAYREERILTGIAMFNGLKKYRFREIVIIADGMVHKKATPEGGWNSMRPGDLHPVWQIYTKCFAYCVERSQHSKRFEKILC